MTNDRPTTATSPFSATELQRWRQLLVEKAAAITDDIAELRQEADDIANTGSVSKVPTHLADQGSEQDTLHKDLSFVRDEEELLWQITRAVKKIDSSEPVPFGICEYSGEPIEAARLEILPWTPLSIAGVAAMEEQGLALADMVIAT